MGFTSPLKEAMNGKHRKVMELIDRSVGCLAQEMWRLLVENDQDTFLDVCFFFVFFFLNDFLFFIFIFVLCENILFLQLLLLLLDVGN